MDLVAGMLLNSLQDHYSGVLRATRVCPPMRRRLTTEKSEISAQSSKFAAKCFNADRLLNRFWDYPRYLRSIKNDFDLFHAIDHSYGQLLHELPPEKSVITCHDLDTFRCLLEPEQEPRSIFFRKMMERTLSGFRRAALVTCDSGATRDQLLTYDLVSANRAVVVPNGVHPSCSPEPDSSSDSQAAKLIGGTAEGKLDILHVGSTIPRKRIDVLLQVFASLKKAFPQARLLRVGGNFTVDQLALAEKLELRNSILVLPRVDAKVLAAIYRRAEVVLQPSEREGFGLPIVEALACGAPVIASDLTVLKEVGGDAAVYCPIGDLPCWSERAISLLNEKRDGPEALRRKQLGFNQAAKFSWAEYARKIVDVYQQLI